MNAFFYPSKRGINFAKIRGFKVTDYMQRGKACRCSGDVVGSKCCIIGKQLAEAQAAGAGAKAQNPAADAF